MRRALSISLLVIMIAAASLRAAPEARLMRFPDVSRNAIVFTYAGDLWTAPLEGGIARRLTTHGGYERFAKYSPDGRWIAFSASYDGNEDVYVMPAEGGVPKRLTFGPSPDWVLGWHPDGKRVLFRANAQTVLGRSNRLYLVDMNGGFPETLAPPEGELTTFSPDAKKIAYTRHGREFRTWKRYRGGWQEDVWIYDLENNESERITDFQGTDAFPMWHGDRIYFISDRDKDKKVNIHRYDIGTRAVRRITSHDAYDVKWPSLGAGVIAYENGGWLYVLDLETEKTRKVPIEIPADNVLARPGYRNVGGHIGSVGISKTGKRAVVEARGDIFTVPAEKGDWRNITQTSGARERAPVWSPDGRWIAYMSDKTGEYEIYLKDPEGKNEERQLSKYLKNFPFLLEWSPDSKKLLFHDQTYSLYYIDIDEKVIHRIDRGAEGDLGDYAWSPDSKWVAYSKTGSNQLNAIFLYSLADGKIHQATNGFYNDFNPAFDPQGKYLYFISSRSWYPLIAQFEFNFSYVLTSELCVLTLRAETPSPLAPESDEEETPKDEETKEETAEKADDSAKAPEKGKKNVEKEAAKKDAAAEEKKEDPKNGETKDIEIDLDGLADRIVSLPVAPGNYGGVEAGEGRIYFVTYPDAPAPFGDSDLPQRSFTLMVYDLKSREAKEVMSGIQGYDLSADGKKLLYLAQGGVMGITDAAPGKKPGDGKIDTQGLQAFIDPAAEWRQLFDEAWRLERDFFYDPDMHGVDWPKMKDRYGQLVPHVAHRADLNYVMGELLGELCSSHAYISGGDLPRSQRTPVGLLGCDYAFDAKSGRYRIAKIFTGRNWDRNYYAPLAQPGIDVADGDWLISINGRDLRSPATPDALLQNAVGKQVVIAVSKDPSGTEAKSYTVVPAGSETLIRYHDWVETNRRKVAEATGGRVGYMHVPTTEIFGFNEFVRSFYSEFDKEGLVVDVRGNAGGWPPDQMIERLSREVISYWARREGTNYVFPSPAPRGHMVCIIDEYAGSGGDMFPFFFREKGLGPLIGMTTWGGLIGYSRSIPLMDGGSITMPDASFMNARGEWDVENKGVKPDIEVDQIPELVAAGRDPQLEKAIEVVMEKIRNEPKRQPERPKAPDRS